MFGNVICIKNRVAKFTRWMKEAGTTTIYIYKETILHYKSIAQHYIILKNC